MDEFLNQLRSKLRKAFEIARDDVATIRSGRATPAIVESIQITAYEGTQNLKLTELATITTMDAKTLVIAPFDPSIVRDIEKGLLEANIGLTPVLDGDVIRLSIPPLSEERRREYLKLARTKLEAGKVIIRQIRHEALRQLRKMEEANEVTEDDRKKAEEEIQDYINEQIASLDALGEKKEAELLMV